MEKKLFTNVEVEYGSNGRPRKSEGEPSLQFGMCCLRELMCAILWDLFDRTIDLFPCEIYTGMKRSVNFIILNITDDHDRWTLYDHDFVKSSLKTYMYSERKCKLINGELGWNYHTVR